MFASWFTELDKTIDHRRVKKWIQQEFRGWYEASVALLSPIMGHDLYEVDKVLADLNALDMHMNGVCEVPKRSGSSIC